MGTDVLEHLLPFASGHTSLCNLVDWSLWEKLNFVFTAKCVPYIQCARHNDLCMLSEVDIDVSGFPCIDYSPAGSQLGLFGPTLPVLLALLHWHRQRRTKLVFLENVPEFPIAVVKFLMEDMYDVQHFYMKPADACCEYLSRMRIFIVLMLRGQDEGKNMKEHMCLVFTDRLYLF